MKPTVPRDMEREHWEEILTEKGVCVCVEELEVDERRVTEKEQGNNHVPTVSSPFLPAIANREVST